MIESLPLEIFEDRDEGDKPATQEPDIEAAKPPGSQSLAEADEKPGETQESIMCQWCGEHFDVGLDACPGCGARAVNPEIVLREPQDVRLSRPPTNWTVAGGYAYGADTGYGAGADLAEGLLGPFIDLFARMFDD